MRTKNWIYPKLCSYSTKIIESIGSIGMKNNNLFIYPINYKEFNKITNWPKLILKYFKWTPYISFNKIWYNNQHKDVIIRSYISKKLEYTNEEKMSAKILMHSNKIIHLKE